MKPVIVVGAGLAGCLISIFLARRGFPVCIYEKKSDPRLPSADSRRPSINLTLCKRGLVALESVGVTSSLQALLTPVHARVVHLEDGTLRRQPYGGPLDAIYSIQRRELNGALLSATEHVGVEVQFRSGCIDIDPAAGHVVLETGKGRALSPAASCIIAADGATSQVRARLKHAGHVQDAIEPYLFGYKVLQMPARTEADQIAHDTIEVWPRGSSMAIAFPNRDSSRSVAFHLPLSGSGSFGQLTDVDAVDEFISKQFADLRPRLEDPGGQFLLQRANSMFTLRCDRWHANGRVVLIGDAAHAVLPHYGQGANAAFEDCHTLAKLLDQHGPDWPNVFSEFERRRRPDAEAIAALCLEHSHELHYSVSDTDFELRVELEKRLHELFPAHVVPLYSMISFSTMPYHEVRRRDRIQRGLIGALMLDRNITMKFQDPGFIELLRPTVEKDLSAVGS